MKKAFSKWYNYIYALILVAFVIAIAVIPYFLVDDSKLWPKVYISYVMLLSAVIYIGGGFIAQDFYRASKRRKTNNWDFPLEEEYIDVAWKIFSPFVIAGVLLLISGLITYLIFK